MDRKSGRLPLSGVPTYPIPLQKDILPIHAARTEPVLNPDPAPETDGIGEPRDPSFLLFSGSPAALRRAPPVQENNRPMRHSLASRVGEPDAASRGTVMCAGSGFS